MNTFLVTALGMFIIVAGIAVAAFIPAAAVYIGYRRNQYWLVAYSAVVALIASVVLSDVLAGLYAVIILLPFSYSLYYCMTQRIEFFRTTLIAMAVLIVSIAVVFFIVNKRTDGEIINRYYEYIDSLVPIIKENAGILYDEIEESDITEFTREIVNETIPSLLVCSCFLISLFGYSMSASAINKTCEKKVKYKAFHLWEAPPAFGCSATIAVGIALLLTMLEVAWAEPIVLLVMCCFLLMLEIKGACSFMFYQKTHKMPTIPAWIIIIILTSAVPVLLLILGFIDNILHLRLSYMYKHKMIKVRNAKPVQEQLNIFKTGKLEDDNETVIHDSEIDGDKKDSSENDGEQEGKPDDENKPDHVNGGSTEDDENSRDNDENNDNDDNNGNKPEDKA